LSKLIVRRTGNGLPKLVGNPFVVVATKGDKAILPHQAQGKLVVAVLDAMGATFLKPCRQYLVVTALGPVPDDVRGLAVPEGGLKPHHPTS
jgi:hypothetical protein